MNCGYSSNPLVMGFLRHGRGIDDSRDQARDGIDDDARREFAAGQHVVADRDLFCAQDLDRAVVDPLVAPADDRDPRARRQLFGKGLGEEPATRRHDEDPRSGEIGSQGRLDRGDDGRGHHDHPGATTIGRVVDGAMAIDPPNPGCRECRSGRCRDRVPGARCSRRADRRRSRGRA